MKREKKERRFEMFSQGHYPRNPPEPVLDVSCVAIASS